VKEPNQRVTLEFLDAAGAVIKGFTSDQDAETAADSLKLEGMKAASIDSLIKAGASRDSATKVATARYADPRVLMQSIDIEEFFSRPPRPARYHLVGFSYGAVCGGYVAAREGDRVLSFTTIGAAALGVPWSGLTGTLRMVETGMTEAEILDVQRHNLHAIMMAAEPSRIDDLAAWLQLENTRRARIRTHTVAAGDTLIRALRRSSAPLTAIWGRDDVFLRPGLAERERVLRGLAREVTVHLVDDAGHWAMYEAPDRVNALLLAAFNRTLTNVPNTAPDGAE
jgi:pimeloyl-ACP methyl ester carboxylesterase